MKKPWTWALVLGLLLAGAASAQDKPEPPKALPSPLLPAPQPRKPTIPLRVQVVFTKQQGDRKVVSLPYTMMCNADDLSLGPGSRQGRVALRMGIEVPIPTVKEGSTSIQYRNVGTNIDCLAFALDGDRYKLELSVEQSSIYSTADEKVRATDESARNPARETKAQVWDVGGTSTAGLPLFRTFNTTFNSILRDGQTAQYTTATDPISGEVVKIDVTVNVVK